MMENILYKKNFYSFEQLKDIARLHLRDISSGFLSSLGLKFLTCLYDSVARSDGGVLIAAIDSNNKVVGFVSGTTSIRSVYNYLVSHHLFHLVPLVFKFAFSAKTVKRILEIKKYTTQERANVEEMSAELLSIVVIERLRGEGIAKELFKQLMLAFRHGGVKQFKIIVGSQLIPAQRFYVKVGAIKTEEIELHKGELSFMYQCSV